MLIVLASNDDSVAQALVARWADAAAVLLTCSDIAQPGWRHAIPQADDGRIMLGGRQVATNDIHGVLNRLPFVNPSELTSIAPSDRQYVSFEMAAFLTWWLWQLPCPVLNRPTAASLMGPGWRSEQWVLTAAQLGMPTRAAARRVELNGGPAPTPEVASGHTVTVVGRRCFGAVDGGQASYAQRLARAAKVELLSIHFTHEDQEFIGADVWIDAATPEIADALLEDLTSGGTC